jgi:antitoxin HigA-1
MPMKNPPHPGLSVRHDCIEPLGLTITEAAKVLGVTRQTLNNLVNGKSGISADMAIRLDKAFGGDAETWLRLQMAYDLAQARQHEVEINVKRVGRRKLNAPHPSSAPRQRP